MVVRVLRPDGSYIVKAIHGSDNPATCPVRALRAWLGAAGLTSGPVFRPIDRHGNVKPSAISDQSISLIIKRVAPLFGLNPDAIGSQSLRAGLVVDLMRAGVDDETIVKQTGHRKLENLERYREQAMEFNYVKAVRL